MRVALHRRLRGFANSSTSPRPERMLRRGRAVDNNFRFYHCLYSRCEKEDVLGNWLNPDRIRAENPSVNWSKFSKPWDAIFDYPLCGFAQHVVCALPGRLPETLPNKKAKFLFFRPQHKPEGENYSHSEICTFKEGALVEKPSLGSIVKKEFRTEIAKRSVILRYPLA